MRDKTRKAFKSVIRNAGRLKNLSFKENIKTIKMTWKWNQDRPEELEIEGPNQEQLEAFLLTFRKFIQQKDQCSFKYLANNVLDDPNISDEWKEAFTKLRGDLNNFLDDKPSFMPIQFEKESVASRKEILRTFIYGMYAHDENEKRANLEKWRNKNKLLEGIFDTQFLRTVIGVSGAIMTLASLCEKEL